MPKVYLLLGSNLGDRWKNLELALFLLEEMNVKILNKSRIYETEPWGVTDQPAFYNQAVEVETNYSPEDLLQSIKDVEQKMGRKDTGRWQERLIDIDIIYYNDVIFKSERLEVPHPEMQSRKFVLFPLAEIAKDKIHPKLKISTYELLQRCNDPLQITPVN